MTQEDKQILLKDLSARLPYGAFVSCAEGTVMGIHWNKIPLDASLFYAFQEEDALEYVRPYLRPMSSMTEEEVKEYKHLVAFSGSPDGTANFIDWLNAHHFDYHRLIGKGLAIEVTKENNPYKE